MAQFKGGDLVKRVDGNWRGIKEGDTSRVSVSYEGHNIQLEDFPGITFDSTKFELVAEAATAHQGKRGFKVGDRVRMINETPNFGRGRVNVGDIGTISEDESDGLFRVDFPLHSSWNAEACDLEHVDPLPEEILPEVDVSLDVAVKSWQDASQQIKELQASLAGFERVMRKHGVKPL